MLIHIPINDQVKFTKISICFIIVLYILWGCFKTVKHFPLLKTEPFLGSKVWLLSFGVEEPLLLRFLLPSEITCRKEHCSVRDLPTRFLSGF